MKNKPNYFDDLEVYIFNLQKKNKEVLLGIVEDSASLLGICPISEPSGPKINFEKIFAEVAAETESVSQKAQLDGATRKTADDEEATP